MEKETVYALRKYFETLYYLNQNLIMLCGVDIIDHSSQCEKYVTNIIQAIPRIVPYSYSKSKQKYALVSRDGLLEFSDEMPYLSDALNTILQNNYSFLVNVKAIRNIFEHKMHAIRLESRSSGSAVLFATTYIVKGENISISAGELINLTKELNALFSDIQRQLNQYLYDNGDEFVFYHNLVRYDFCNFNKIFDCEDLRLIGKAFCPF